MTWAKLDDRLYDDPRCEAAGPEAMGLWVLALSYMGAYHTDGWITLARCRRLVGAQHGKRLAQRLVDAGWWESPELPPGSEPAFRLLGWEAYLIPSDEAEARSARASEAGRRGGRARGEAARSGKGSGQGSDQGRHQDPPPCPGSTPEALAGKSSEALDTGQATRAPDPDPTRPDPDAHARDHARGITQGEDLLFPDLATPPPEPKTPKPRTTRKPATPPPEDPSVLPPRERAVYDAIAGDVSLQPITRGVVQLAVDLCAIAPLVPDVAHVVRRAGAWMREKPQNAKRNGNTFLLNWLEREQKAAAEQPQPAPAGSASRIGGPPRRAPIDLPGTVGPERPIPPLRPPPVPRDVVRGVDAAIAAGEPVPTMADVHAALARIGRRRLPPDPPEAS